jgi:hypothetical protein
MKNKMHKLILAYFDKHTLQYHLIKVYHYGQRWRHAQFSSIFVFRLAAPYFFNQICAQKRPENVNLKTTTNHRVMGGG